MHRFNDHRVYLGFAKDNPSLTPFFLFPALYTKGTLVPVLLRTIVILGDAHGQGGHDADQTKIKTSALGRGRGGGSGGYGVEQTAAPAAHHLLLGRERLFWRSLERRVGEIQQQLHDDGNRIKEASVARKQKLCTELLPVPLWVYLFFWGVAESHELRS